MNNPEPDVVARELVRRFGVNAEVARKQMCAIAQDRGRTDALLTLMQAQGWIELLRRVAR